MHLKQRTLSILLFFLSLATFAQNEWSSTDASEATMRSSTNRIDTLDLKL